MIFRSLLLQCLTIEIKVGYFLSTFLANGLIELHQYGIYRQTYLYIIISDMLGKWVASCPIVKRLVISRGTEYRTDYTV